jgi:Fe-S cluster assembly ATP-binding protein
MLDIQHLSCQLGSIPLLSDISFHLQSGEIIALLGKNGSGKSSLAKCISGLPEYRQNSGVILYNGKEIQDMPLHERSRLGIFLALQHIPEIPGIALGEFLRSIYNLHKKQQQSHFVDITPFVFRRFIKKYLVELEIAESFLERDLFVGFSGGEKRKIELLQMLLLEPQYIICDEIDAGVDIDAIKLVIQTLKKLTAQ